MRSRILWAIPTLLLICAQSWAADSEWLIVPGERVGKITAASSEAELKKAYGDSNVEAAEVPIGEGETEKGSVLFPKDPKKKIFIVWNDSKKKVNPVRVQLDEAPSVWKTAEGISTGTSLKELEKLNGKAFTLTGFGWDYSGTVISWNEGKLNKLNDMRWRMILRLEPEHGENEDGEALGSVQGDRDRASSHEAMQKLNPKVYQIVIEMVPKAGS